MRDETPISYPCPLCKDPMRFIGIDYYHQMEQYFCPRCLELEAIEIPPRLPVM